nr:serine/threonine protein kinase SRPK1 [Tanacetum cinerariifolium]
MPPRVMTRSVGRPAAASRRGGTGRRVGIEGRRVREPRRRNVKPTGEPEGQENDQSVKVNEGVDGVPDFSTIIAQQLQNLLPAILSKTLDEGYSCKNYVRKFLRALHPKWRAKVMTIEESKDLTSLSLDKLIRNLKVHEMIIKKDSEIVKANVERKSLSLKAKKQSSDEQCSTSRSEDEEYAMVVIDFKKFFKRRDKNQRVFVGGSWSDSGEEDDEKVNNKTCLVAQTSSEVCSESFYFSDENSSIDDLVLDNEYDKL